MVLSACLFACKAGQVANVAALAVVASAHVVSAAAQVSAAEQARREAEAREQRPAPVAVMERCTEVVIVSEGDEGGAPRRGFACGSDVYVIEPVSGRWVRHE